MSIFEKLPVPTDGVAIGYGATEEEHEVVLGGPTVTSFRVGDWLHLAKDDDDVVVGSDQVLVTREWVDSIEERLVFLEGLVNCMSTDLRHVRERQQIK